MRRRKSTVLFAIMLITFLCLAPVHQNAFSGSPGEGNKRWGWFSALSLTNKWRIFEGTADVVLNDGKLKAELYDGDEHGFHCVSVTGTVKNGRIKAVAIRHGNDDSPRKLTGMLTRYKWGRTSILLHENDAGGFVIGLTLETDR